jgi:hypothetical protein
MSTSRVRLSIYNPAASNTGDSSRQAGLLKFRSLIRLAQNCLPC